MRHMPSNDPKPKIISNQTAFHLFVPIKIKQIKGSITPQIFSILFLFLSECLEYHCTLLSYPSIYTMILDEIRPVPVECNFLTICFIEFGVKALRCSTLQGFSGLAIKKQLV